MTLADVTTIMVRMDMMLNSSPGSCSCGEMCFPSPPPPPTRCSCDRQERDRNRPSFGRGYEHDSTGHPWRGRSAHSCRTPCWMIDQPPAFLPATARQAMYQTSSSFVMVEVLSRSAPLRGVDGEPGRTRYNSRDASHSSPQS